LFRVGEIVSLVIKWFCMNVWGVFIWGQLCRGVNPAGLGWGGRTVPGGDRWRSACAESMPTCVAELLPIVAETSSDMRM